MVRPRDHESQWSGARVCCPEGNSPHVEGRTTRHSDPDTVTAPAISNWGQFGPDDQLGTLNYLEPEQVLAGAKCIQTGERFPLNLPANLPIWWPGGRPNLERHSLKINHVE